MIELVLLSRASGIIIDGNKAILAVHSLQRKVSSQFEMKGVFLSGSNELSAVIDSISSYDASCVRGEGHQNLRHIFCFYNPL